MIKKRVISMLLSILMLLTCFCVQSPTEVSAEKQTVWRLTADSIIVESGKKFYVGDYVYVWMTGDGDTLASMVGASYEVDNPEVIKVEENGYATTKEPGNAVVTVSYQGQSAEFSVTVVEKETLSAGKEEMVEKWEAAGKKLAKKLPSTLTVNNGYTFIKVLKIYLKAVSSNCTNDDFDMNYVYGRDTYREEDEAYEVLSPICKCYERALMIMGIYIHQYYPVISNKISANENQITLKCKKKIGSKELLALYLEEVRYQITNDEANLPLKIDVKIQNNRLESRVYLSAVDKKGNEIGDLSKDIVATAIFKKGSKTITIKPTAVRKYVNGKYKDVKKKNLKFVKGRTYKMWNGTLVGEYASKYVTIK